MPAPFSPIFLMQKGQSHISHGEEYFVEGDTLRKWVGLSFERLIKEKCLDRAQHLSQNLRRAGWVGSEHRRECPAPTHPGRHWSSLRRCRTSTPSAPPHRWRHTSRTPASSCPSAGTASLRSRTWSGLPCSCSSGESGCGGVANVWTPPSPPPPAHPLRRPPRLDPGTHYPRPETTSDLGSRHEERVLSRTAPYPAGLARSLKLLLWLALLGKLEVGNSCKYVSKEGLSLCTRNVCWINDMNIDQSNHLQPQTPPALWTQVRQIVLGGNTVLLAQVKSAKGWTGEQSLRGLGTDGLWWIRDERAAQRRRGSPLIETMGEPGAPPTVCPGFPPWEPRLPGLLFLLSLLPTRSLQEAHTGLCPHYTDQAGCIPWQFIQFWLDTNK